MVGSGWEFGKFRMQVFLDRIAGMDHGWDRDAFRRLLCGKVKLWNSGLALLDYTIIHYKLLNINWVMV